jgi:hypothetical protein
MEVSGQLHALVDLTPGIHWIGGWVGLRVCLDTVEKEKFVAAPAGNRTPVVHPVARRYID